MFDKKTRIAAFGRDEKDEQNEGEIQFYDKIVAKIENVAV